MRRRWVDIYTGQMFIDPSQLDVDHMAPLANAHRTGEAAWSTTVKAGFVTYLGIDDALIASPPPPTAPK